MKLSLSENIRSFRKQRKMTQEKLAEALGVTVGAVYKWESGQSQPELNLLVEMADFFDISVDALLGYRIKETVWILLWNESTHIAGHWTRQRFLKRKRC